MGSLDILFKNIADAIRIKKESTEGIRASDFPNQINSLEVLKGETLEIQPSVTDEIYTPSEGYNGLTKVKAVKVTKDIDVNIIQSNIRKDVSILGVTGTLQDGLDTSGCEDVKVFATRDISAGNVCALTPPTTTEYSASVKYILPATAKFATSTTATPTTVNLDVTKPATFIDNGNIAIGFYAQSTSLAYPLYFLLVDGEYKQLMYNGSYYSSDYPYGSPTSTSDDRFNLNKNGFAYDKVIDRLYVYSVNNSCLRACRIDRENMNIIPEASLSASYYACGIFAHNRNVFFGYVGRSTGGGSTYQYYYDVATKSFTKIGLITRNLTNTTTSNSQAAFDYALDSIGNLYIYVMYYPTGSSPKWTGVFEKMTLDTSGIYQFANNKLILYPKTNMLHSSSGSSHTNGIPDPYLNIDYGGGTVIYIDANSVMHYLTIDTESMTATEVDVPFDDGLDKTKIANIKLIKGENFLFIKSTDSQYSNDEKLRLYYFDGIQFKFVCCPSLTLFSPLNTVSTMPTMIPSEMTSRYIAMKPSSGAAAIYEIKLSNDEYDYVATPTDNIMLSDADAYGIAIENIEMSAIGDVVLVIREQIDAFNTAINDKIGGAY